jgi:glycosyltransferase involved in cell wall biosynthesis
MKAIAIIASQAFSLHNFRGPLICDLVAAGITVYALAPDYDDHSRAVVTALGAVPVDFEMSRTGISPWRDGRALLDLTVLLRHLKPDVTLGYFIKPVIYGTLAAWLAGVPRRVAMIEGLGYVFTPSGDRITWRRKLLKALVSKLYKFSLGKAHQVILLNRDDLAYLVKSRLLDESKALILGGIGVELADWPRVPALSRPVTFLLVARLLREKGIVEYAHAAREVKLQHPCVRFLLLGALDPNPGGLREEEIQAWVAEGLLEWPGHVAVKPWLEQASVFVLPSYREGFPRSSQEAMAMGRPVITTDVPGCRDTVQEGVNGFLVPVRDVHALADAMLRFVRDPGLIETMGGKSRDFAEVNFDVHKINRRLLKVLGF